MRPRRGFTLVELLVVIAIIGILAGFIAAGLPRVIEKAKLSSTVNTFNQLRTILVAYYTDHNSLPPAYGYVSDLFLRDTDFSDPLTRHSDIAALVGSEFEEEDVFFLVPWMSAFREHGNQDLYDNWTRGNGYDTDNDNLISRMEFAPIGLYNDANQSYSFDFEQLYRGPSAANDPITAADLQRQRDDQGPRAFVYVPVNERQFRLFRNIIYEMAGRQGNSSDPRPFNLDQIARDAIQAQLSFPPPSYDAFVLISVGPSFVAGTNGILVDGDRMGLNNFDDPIYVDLYQYHLMGLATYFMATRDAENGGKGDGDLDFDFKARSSRGQGKNSDNDMPGSQPKGAGPLIYKGNV